MLLYQREGSLGLSIPDKSVRGEYHRLSTQRRRRRAVPNGLEQVLELRVLLEFVERGGGKIGGVIGDRRKHFAGFAQELKRFLELASVDRGGAKYQRHERSAVCVRRGVGCKRSAALRV